MKRRRPRAATPGQPTAMLAGAVLAGAVMFHGLAFPSAAAQAPHDRSGAGPAGTSTTDQSTGTFALPPLSRLPQTRMRPLFSVGRRPPLPAAVVAPPLPPVAQAPAAIAQPPAVLILTGIAHGADRRVAILRNAGTNAVNRVEKGQVIDGWSVEDIDTRSVVLRKNSTMQRLELFRVPVPKR